MPRSRSKREISSSTAAFMAWTALRRCTLEAFWRVGWTAMPRSKTGRTSSTLFSVERLRQYHGLRGGLLTMPGEQHSAGVNIRRFRGWVGRGCHDWQNVLDPLSRTSWAVVQGVELVTTPSEPRRRMRTRLPHGFHGKTAAGKIARFSPRSDVASHSCSVAFRSCFSRVCIRVVLTINVLYMKHKPKPEKKTSMGKSQTQSYNSVVSTC